MIFLNNTLSKSSLLRLLQMQQISKFPYLFSQLSRRFSKSICPSCGSTSAHQVDSKYFGVSVLLQCNNCSLRYRFPVNSPTSNDEFYQNSYRQAGLTTDLPSKQELQILLEQNFSCSEKDFSLYFPLLQSIALHLNREISVLDYGANWGYACHQFNSLGFTSKVCGYELSRPRMIYGRENLGISYVNDPSEVKGSFDVIFSSHCIEHMSNPSELKKWTDLVLRDDGYVVLICPNGSDYPRIKDPSWSKLWNEVHPNYISDQYLSSLFSDYNGLITSLEESSDFNSLDLGFSCGIQSLRPSGSNLLFIAQKNSIR